MDDIKTVALANDDAAFVEGLVDRGFYASADEVVRAGLKSLKDTEGGLDAWIQREIFSVVEALEADPSSGIPAEEVFEELRARHAARFGGE